MDGGWMDGWIDTWIDVWDGGEMQIVKKKKEKEPIVLIIT